MFKLSVAALIAGVAAQGPASQWYGMFLAAKIKIKFPPR
jgi:hypothetical protein